MNQRQQWKLTVVAVLVAITGFLTISDILFVLIHFRRPHIVSSDAHFTLLAGLTLIYLATLLNRGKRNAWIIALPVFVFLVLRNARHFIFDFPGKDRFHFAAVLSLALPLVTLVALIYYRQLFNVRSELRNFTTALQRSIIILLVALAYGVAGFVLMDEHDFHQDIKPATAIHYTFDQFGLTTTKHATAYTRRSHVFVDSLAAISLGAVFYTFISLFSPIRFRLSHHRQDRDDIKRLIDRYSRTSEDFFMLWPPDKSYFFSAGRTAAMAYKAVKGVALIVGDPIGSKDQIEDLLTQFMGFCLVNDWQPAFIHADYKNLKLYQSLGFEAQKIGEEAIVNTAHFMSNVATSKDFRHINNRFNKLGYKCEVLEPPHSDAILHRLKLISNDWLSKPGRAERGFMLGYFTSSYMNQCPIFAVKDGSGQIQAFMNQVPSPIVDEANFDFLRHSSDSPGNINDYLMLNFITHLHQQGVPRLNMGLSALAGLDEATDSTSRLLNRFLKFAYSNGNRFFSFKGLNRFKAKYEPEWEDRYIIYRGGIRGFSKTINALMRAMRLK